MPVTAWPGRAKRAKRLVSMCRRSPGPAITRGPHPLRRLAAQIHSCSGAGRSRGLRRGREERSCRQLREARSSSLDSRQRRYHLQAVAGETPWRLAASLSESPHSIERTSACRPDSPSLALRCICIRVLPWPWSSQTHSLGQGPDGFSAVHNVLRHVT